MSTLSIYRLNSWQKKKNSNNNNKCTDGDKNFYDDAMC